MTEVYLDQNWQQINPQRSVDATSFKNGSILFNFNVSGLNSVSLKDSYFLINSSLTMSDGTTAHQIQNRTTYAHNWASTLFSNVSVRVSGQEVSVCNQYNHIAHTCKMRQMVNEDMLNTNMRDMMDYDPDFTRRLYKHCSAGSNDTFPNRAISMREDGNVEQANKGGTNIRNGDKSRYTVYQPVNLGVFDLGHGSGLCGDISILLNPNPNFETFAVESALFDGNEFKPVESDAATAYKLQIQSIVFMACYAKASKPIDSLKTFQISEYQVMNKPYSSQLEFQVLPSTEQITIAIQDVQAGSSTIYPATVFKVRQNKSAGVPTAVADQAVKYGKQYTDDENGSIQVTLGATTKPPIMISPSKNTPGEIGGQMIRWLMSHQFLDGHKSLYERYNDWCSSPYYCFDFMRDSSDTSGFVTVRSEYTHNSPNLWPENTTPNLFCISKYSKLVKIEYASGYVTSIQIQNS